jgi:hypothetical protein
MGGHTVSCIPAHLGQLPKSDIEAEFFRTQRDIEIKHRRFSPSFGCDLLPGMYSMPIHAIPKPQQAQLRMVVDHSAGTYSLNSMIPRAAVAGSRLDTIIDLVTSLLEFRHEFGPEVKLVLFKSDVSAAYRRIPVHPLWQIKQIITIDGLSSMTLTRPTTRQSRLNSSDSGTRLDCPMIRGNKSLARFSQSLGLKSIQIS